MQIHNASLCVYWSDSVGIESCCCSDIDCYSINFDFLPNSKFKIRTEGKWYYATENIFDTNTKKDNFSVTTTMSFEF